MAMSASVTYLTTPVILAREDEFLCGCNDVYSDVPLPLAQHLRSELSNSTNGNQKGNFVFNTSPEFTNRLCFR